MKNMLLLVLLFSLIASTSFAGDPEKKGSEYCSEKKMNSQVQKMDVLGPVLHSFNVLNYKIDMDIYNCFITPYPKTFNAVETITLKVDSTLSTISLNAVNTSLQINSVSLAGTSFTHTSNILTITLNRVYVPGETLSVQINYQHKTPPSQDGWYVRSGVVFTDAEPEGARTWFPCWDKPSDKATTDIRVKVPATVKMGGNGRLADSTKSQDTIWYNWISRDPVATYLTVLTGKVNYSLEVFYWRKISNPNDSIQMRFYYNAGETALNYKQPLLNMTTRFSTLFTEMPFEKNGFALIKSSEGFTWGGMENQTLTTIYAWGENLISHEYAHQWFGDMITCATWADIFLNEGFATYCEALWYENTGGYTSYKSDINGDASSYLSSNPGWPISNPDWAINTPNINTLFNTAITYNKGACVLHMLRYLMGDVKFFEGMKAYANSEFKYSSAKIADFAGVMGTAYGQDLSWYFNQWTLTPNHPLYANQYYLSPQPNNKYEVGFLAKQTQTNTGFFTMPLEIKIRFTDNTDTTVVAFNNVNNQLFSWLFNKQPNLVTFDPNNNIVLKTATLTQVPPMPVELTSFTASVNGNNVTLNWETATELNNKGFEIERALDVNVLDGITEGLQFSTIGFTKGQGTSTSSKIYSFTDKLSAFGKYVYRLKQIDFNGAFEYSPNVSVSAGVKPSSYSLMQNYPNPFNPSTIISFEVPKTSKVKLTVYNILGQQVSILADGIFGEGVYQRTFDAAGLSSGIYIYELKSDDFQIRKKMVFEK